MRKRIGVLVAGLLLTLTVGVAPASAAHSYPNCDALHRAHRNGVAKTQTAANHQANSGHYRPFVNRSLYIANDNLDADNDGTACEVSR